MAITIKEIHVVTTITKDPYTKGIDDEALKKLKEEIIGELKRREKNKQRLNDERQGER